MDDELLKRNTDCVYFLASPFTCKKGVECEYRHSDMARLNPRDCWYWLSGSCLNPTCAFRHPPLEIHTEATPNASASLVSQPSVPATKSTVPCYFYFYGFCKKGDRCPFLHEPDESHSLKPKMAETISDIPIQSLDAKTSRSDQETAPEKNSPSLFEMAVKGGDGFQVQQKQHVQQQALNDMLILSTHAHACAPDCEETAVVDAPLLQPVEVSPESECEPILDSDPSSEELMDGNIVRDEWCESSPGFDVLVDGEAEDITYEDDPEYLCALSGNDGDHGGVIMQHGVDENDYDERIFFRNRLYDSSDLIYGEHRADLGEYSPRRAKNRKGGRVSHKRKLLPMEFPVGGCNFLDLRDYLRKRRTVDSYLETQSWRHVMVHRRRDESLQRHAFNQQLRGRVAAKVGRNGVGLARTRTLAVEAYQRGRRRSSLRYKSRESVNGIKRRRLPNEGKRRSSMKRECDLPVSNTFDGPKSLAEIKEESRRGRSNGNGSVDFDGPKPLSEILKAKKQPTCASNGEVSGSF